MRIDPTFSDADWVSLNADYAGTNGRVYTVTANLAGNVYVAGDFTKAGTVDANRIARWDGTRWWPLGSGLDGTAYTLRFVDGNLYAGGNFLTAGGAPATRIARWDGSAWHALGSGLDDIPYSIMSHENRIYTGGSFTSAGGLLANRVACWDGASWSAVGVGMNDTVNDLLSHQGELYACGSFTTADGLPAERVAVWSNGAWSEVGGGVSGSPNSIVWFQNKLHVAGWDLEAGTIPPAGLIAWNGTSWGLVSFQPVLCAAATYTQLGYLRYTGKSLFEPNEVVVNGVAVGTLGSPSAGGQILAFAGSDLIIGGDFPDVSVPIAAPPYLINRTRANRLAKWDGTKWSGLTKEINDAVFAAAWHDGSLHIGGAFTSAGGPDTSYLARWTGASWQPLGTGVNGVVRSLVSDSGELYVGGDFTEAGGVLANRVAKWTGSAWEALGSGVNNTVLCMTRHHEVLYVGGAFTSAGGTSASRIAAWDGSVWSAFGAGADSVVRAMAIYDDHVVAAGSFTAIGAVGAARIAKWNGVSWSPLGSGINSSVYALAKDATGLIAGGSFSLAGGVSVKNIARWDGMTWSGIGSGLVNMTVNALEVVGGDLLATGSGLSTNDPLPVFRWNGTVWSQLGSGIKRRSFLAGYQSGQVYAMVLDQSGHLYIGGSFDVAGTTQSPNIVRANFPGSTLSEMEAWRQAQFGTFENAGNAADTADFDHDGLVNLIEYAFALNPALHSSLDQIPQPQRSGADMVLSFTAPAGVSGVTYGAEWSATLAPGSWTTIPNTGTPPQHSFSVPIGANTGMFVRLKVTAP